MSVFNANRFTEHDGGLVGEASTLGIKPGADWCQPLHDTPEWGIVIRLLDGRTIEQYPLASVNRDSEGDLHSMEFKPAHTFARYSHVTIYND